MKKIIFISIIIFIFQQSIFAFIDENDTTSDNKIIPYMDIENESEFNVKNNENDIPQFDSYTNKTNIEMGLRIELNDFFEIAPMIGLSDLIWMIDNFGWFHFNETGIYIGSYFTFKPHEILTIYTWFANMEKFDTETASGVWAGLKTGLEFDFDINKAYLEIEISDDFNPMFQAGNDPEICASLGNTLEYVLVFYFLNFINEEINTGFYCEGKLETGSIYNNCSYDSTSVKHEIFAGITTNPVDFFEGHLAFAMFNEAVVKNDLFIEEGTEIFDFGFKLGVCFTYKWFNFGFDYVPHLFTSIDNVRDKISHYFNLTITINLEKD